MQKPAAAFESRGLWAAVWRRATASDGYTLSEMLVVLAILLVVLTSLTTLFVSASRAQLDMSNRVEAQQNARLALDALRREIRCARDVAGTSSSITITLGAYCPTNTTGAAATVTWCTLDSGGAPPYALWRDSGSSCSGTGMQRADHLIAAAIFSFAAPAMGAGRLWKLEVTLTVDFTPADAKQRYILEDDIVLRNSTRS